MLLILAEVVMPWLTMQGRQLSAATASAALRADAAESAACGYGLKTFQREEGGYFHEKICAARSAVYSQSTGN